MKDLIFNTHDVILLVTVYQSLLFALLIALIPNRRHKSHAFLIGFLITQAFIPLHLLINYGDGFRLIALEVSPNLYRYFEIAYWLEGPLILWYVRSLIYRDFALRKSDLLFLAPVLAYLLWTWFSFYSLNHGEKVAELSGYESVSGPVERHLIGFIREVLRVAFGVMCLIDIRHCRSQIRRRFSNVDDIDFVWLKFLVIGFLIIHVWAIAVSLALILSAHTTYEFNVELMGLTGNYVTFALVSALVLRGLSHVSLFDGVDSRTEILRTLSQQDKTDIKPEIIEKITQHMEESKPFLANILTLEQLAKQLDMSPRNLSNALNRHYQQNFFEFINHYRIKEAKSILADAQHKHKTMIEIMADCGFNSKATFNTFFKKVAGCTPSQYRAKALK